MATHKVPQDVETEDKLIGFLSMKQFIFVVVGLGFGYLTFFFATKVNVFLSIIWVPFTVVPLVLGLYQRHDQPVETYLSSAIRYYFKPRKRRWDQEGFVERVTITAPPKIEHHYTKDFSGEEAVGRLSRLSRLMDSRGWATKLDTDWQNPQLAETASSDSRIQAQATDTTAQLSAFMQPTDIMDEQTSMVARDFQSRIDSTDSTARVHAMKALDQARTGAAAPSASANDSAATAKSANSTPAPPATPTTPAVATAAKPSPLASVGSDTTTDDGSVEIKLH